MCKGTIYLSKLTDMHADHTNLIKVQYAAAQALLLKHMQAFCPEHTGSREPHRQHKPGPASANTACGAMTRLTCAASAAACYTSC
jgi:hypothetical protein